MADEIFRKKSIDRMSSPEDLNDYLHVTSPPLWILLAAVILLMAGVFVWSGFATIESRAEGKAESSGGVVTVTLDNELDANNLEVGMTADIGGTPMKIKYLGTADDGGLIVGLDGEVPDGSYDFFVTYRTTKVLSMLLN